MCIEARKARKLEGAYGGESLEGTLGREQNLPCESKERGEEAAFPSRSGSFAHDWSSIPAARWMAQVGLYLGWKGISRKGGREVGKGGEREDQPRLRVEGAALKPAAL